MKFLASAFLSLLLVTTILAQTEDSTKNYNIEEVVVKSYRLEMMLKDVPNKVEVIGNQQITRTPALSIADIIKKSTTCESVDLQGLTAGVDFRGFAPGGMGTNRFSAMLIDGMPMGTMNAATTLMSGISSIEVLKGPFSALYGSGAMGGVVNIITKQSRGEISGSALVGYGSYNTTQASASVGGNLNPYLDFDLALEFFKQFDDYKTGGHSTLNTTDYEKNVLDPASFAKEYKRTAYDKQGAVLRVGYDVSQKWRINIYNSLYYTNNAGANGTLWGLYDQTDKGVIRNYHRIDLTYTGRSHNLRFSPYFSQEKSNTDFQSPYGNSTEEKNYSCYGFQLQDIIPLSFGRVIFGIDNFSQRNKSSRFNAEMDPVNPWNPDYMDMQTAVFAQLNVSLFDNRLTSVAGLRYDNTMFRTFRTPHMEMQSSSKFYNSINPAFALKYKIVAGLNVHGSVGRAFLAPDACKTVGEYQTYAIYVGNKYLKPETAVTADLGVGYTYGNGALSLDVTMFTTKHKNLIGSLELEKDTKYTYENTDKATMKGYEAMLSVDFGRMMSQPYSLRLFANYTRIFQSKVTRKGINSERLYVSDNNATFGAEYVGRRLSARISGRYVGDKLNENSILFKLDSGEDFRPALIDDSLIRIPDFMVFDIYVDYAISNTFSIGAKCVNLLDENYMERDGYYQSGRGFFGQLSVRF